MLGGVTTIFEMPNTHPLTLTAQDLQAKLDLARGRAWCDYAFYIGGSAANATAADTRKPAGLRGVKVFMGSSFGDLLADDEAVLRRIVRNGGGMAVHAEDEARLRERRSKRAATCVIILTGATRKARWPRRGASSGWLPRRAGGCMCCTCPLPRKWRSSRGIGIA